jgi:aryl carrier-like protein
MGFSAWLVTAEDLIISKLIWIQDVQSEKQMDDIKNLLESGDLDIVYIVSWIEQLNLKTFDLLPK